jgi:hypothetical protein
MAETPLSSYRTWIILGFFIILAQVGFLYR